MIRQIYASVERIRKRDVRGKYVIVAVGFFWAIGIAIGFNALRRYESTPGTPAISPARWPASSVIRPIAHRASLVMLVHPQCSCTQASLSELTTIMTASHQTLAAWVMVLQPSGAAPGWEKTSMWSSAIRIPGVTVLADPDGIEANKFGARTSGQVVMYDPNGRLLFSGGITGERGHAGDNLGRQRVLQLSESQAPDRHDHDVYGCALFDDEPIV